MKWVETTAEGAKGHCDNSVHPIDLTWKLDNTKTPEYFDLPQVRKAQLDKYSTVKIPWDVNPEASFYVPQCEKAYYPQTCKSNGICEKADMFEDLGLKYVGFDLSSQFIKISELRIFKNESNNEELVRAA